MMASVSDVAGAVGVRFAAKVRCALVPPKPNEERPSWATGNTGITTKVMILFHLSVSMNQGILRGKGDGNDVFRG